MEDLYIGCKTKKSEGVIMRDIVAFSVRTAFRSTYHSLHSKKILKIQKFLIPGEEGIALVMVLVLSLIVLSITATLIYLVIQGTKFSGFHKRYATALDAGFGGTEVASALIANRGELVIAGIGINFPGFCACGFDPDPYDEIHVIPSPDTCLCRKLCIPPYKSDGTYNWNLADCNDSLDPLYNADTQFNLAGFGTNYQVSAKITDTTVGVTDLSGENLSCGAGVGYKCATFEGPPTPYLYRIEINSQDATNATERARLSVLYAY